MMHDKKLLKILWMLLGCYFAALVFFGVIQKFRSGQSIDWLLSMTDLTFYSGYAHNFARPPIVFGGNALSIFYIAWIIFVIIMIVRYQFSRRNKKARVSVYHAVIFAWVVFFVVTTILSLISQAIFFRNHYQIFSQKTLSEKQEYIFENLYRFPQMISRDFPGHYRAEWITDIDTTKEPGMFAHRAVAYFLYPIDIRGIRSPEPFEARIMMDKENAEDFLRDGFVIDFRYSDSFVIAFKGDRDGNHFFVK